MLRWLLAANRQLVSTSNQTDSACIPQFLCFWPPGFCFIFLIKTTDWWIVTSDTANWENIGFCPTEQCTPAHRSTTDYECSATAFMSILTLRWTDKSSPTMTSWIYTTTYRHCSQKYSRMRNLLSSLIWSCQLIKLFTKNNAIESNDYLNRRYL